jgi:hypothetical protein
MTIIEARVQNRSSRLRRIGTNCLGLALVCLCFEWTRIGAITHALHPERLKTLWRPLIGFSPLGPAAAVVLSFYCAVMVFRGSVIAHWIGAVTLASSVVVMILTVH